MSSRPGIIVDVQRDADGGDHPNKFAPYVSAHIRVYWPPKADIKEVWDALEIAHAQAMGDIYDRYYPDCEEVTDGEVSGR